MLEGSEFEMPEEQEMFLFSKDSRSALGPTLDLTGTEVLSRGQTSWGLNFRKCPGKERVDLYRYSPCAPSWLAMGQVYLCVVKVTERSNKSFTTTG